MSKSLLTVLGKNIDWSINNCLIARRNMINYIFRFIDFSILFPRIICAPISLPQDIHLYYICEICVLHMFYTCITGVWVVCVNSNTPKTPHMYYMCTIHIITCGTLVYLPLSDMYLFLPSNLISTPCSPPYQPSSFTPSPYAGLDLHPT